MSRTGILRTLCYSLCMAAVLASRTTPAFGGPVILMGIDAEDQNGGTGCGTSGGHGGHAPYVSVLNGFLPQVTNGGTGILVIGGGKDPPPGSVDHVTGFWNAMGACVTPAQVVTHVNGAANIAAVSFAGKRMIAIASSVNETPSGGLTQSESTAINARAADIAAFVNSGGALIGFSQEGLAVPYGYLGPIGSFSFHFFEYDNVTATAAGQAVGITNSNLDVCCWHDEYITFPSFLSVLATTNESGQHFGHASAIGGATVVIPGQITLTPNLDFNPPGTSHTVTATVVEGTPPNNPKPNVVVTFNVNTGPNMGQTGMATTNASGQASFTYTSNGVRGVDHIQASFLDMPSGNVVLSTPVRKFWDVDCNNNNKPDTCDIACGAFGGNCEAFGPAPGCGGSADANSDGIPDECNLPPVCNAGGPYSAACAGATTTVQLNGAGSSDPNPGDTITFAWTSNCPGASFNDATSATPILTLGTAPGCNVSCMVSLTVTDSHASSSSCSVAVMVTDTAPPTINCPAASTVSCNSEVPAAATDLALFVSQGGSSSDACSGAPTVIHVGDSVSDQTCPNRKTITRTYRATDACGNSATCAQIITVNDQTPPTITCPGTLTVSCMSAVPPADFAGGSASDNCGGTPAIAHVGDVVSNETCPNRKTITRTYRATDACGNTATCTQTIVVDDQTPPTFNNCAPGNTDLGCNPASVPGCNAGVTASDNCGAASVGCVESNSQSGQNHTRTLTYTATDACGNSATCLQTYTWTDGPTPPTSASSDTTTYCSNAPPMNITLSAVGGSGDLLVWYEGGCGAGASIGTGSPLTIPAPTATTTYHARWETPPCGPSTCASTTVTVHAPPSPPTIDSNVATCVCANWAGYVASGPAGAASYAWSITGGAIIPPANQPTVKFTADPGPGNVVLTLVVTDANGCSNTNSETYPICSNCPAPAACPPGSPATCQTGTLLLEGPATGPSCYKNGDTYSVDLYMENVTCPVAGYQAFLKYDCALTFTGGTYSATSPFGNPIIPLTPGSILCNPDPCNPPLSPGQYGRVNVSANVDIAAGAPLPTSGTFHLATLNFVVTGGGACTAEHVSFRDPLQLTESPAQPPSRFTDLAGCGFAAFLDPSCIPPCCQACGLVLDNPAAFKIDGIGPTFTGCPANETVQCVALVQPPAVVMANDACDGPLPDPVPTETVTLGACPNSRTITRTWSATDACGNTSTCTQIITVDDTTPPVITCPPPPAPVNCENQVPAPATDLIQFTSLGGTVSDGACGGPLMVTHVNDVVSNQTCPNRKTITRTYLATDACGNTATCTQTITVDDQTPPTFNNCTPGNTDLECDPAGIPECDTGVTASDDCGSASVTCASADTSTGRNHTRTLTYTATDACGNSATCVQTITWLDGPTPPTSVSLDTTTYCSSSPPMNITLSAVGGSGGTLTWYEGGCGAGASIGTGSPLTIPAPAITTIYYARWETPPCGPSGCASTTVTVQTPTPPPIDSNVTSCVCANWAGYMASGPAGAASYAWSITGGTLIPPTDQQSVKFTANAGPGNVVLTLVITDVNDCSSTNSATYPICSNCTAPANCPVGSPATCQTGTLRLEGPASGPACHSVGDTYSVNLYMENVTCPVAGYQAFVKYDCSLTFTGGTYDAGSPFNNVIIPLTPGSALGNPNPCNPPLSPGQYGRINISANVDVAGGSPLPTSGTFLLATLNFTVTGGGGCVAEHVAFRDPLQLDESPAQPPSRFTDLSGCGFSAFLDPSCTPPCCQTCGLALDNPAAFKVDAGGPILSGCPMNESVQCISQVQPAPVVSAHDACDGPLPNPEPVETVTPGSCENSRTITRVWSAVDTCGNTASCTQTITVQDTMAPTIDCPANVSHTPTLEDLADCDDDDVVALVGVATATDNCTCSAAVTVEGVRSDNQPLSAAYPLGVTTITWTATDCCANTASCQQTVTVQAAQITVAVEISPTIDPTTQGSGFMFPLKRCIRFEAGCIGSAPSVTLDRELTFGAYVNGGAQGALAEATLCVPASLTTPYTCMTARDRLHTLRSTVTPGSGLTQNSPISYAASFTGKRVAEPPSAPASPGPGHRLVSGNLNDDRFIDILDFGTWAGTFDLVYPVPVGPNAPYEPGDTPCMAPSPHSDLSGDGRVQIEDFSLIAFNFLMIREADCCGADLTGEGGAPLTRITVSELRQRGLDGAAAGDVNQDGVLDFADVEAVLGGAQPVAPAKRLHAPPVSTTPR